jgi:pilus assembly protein Flp/PilA
MVSLQGRIRKEGATAVEYALIVAGIAVVIIVAVFALGGQLEIAFNAIKDAIAGAGATAT